jgi:hypothetical protein
MWYFPRPHPDEVAGSLLLRACRELHLPFKRLEGLLSNSRNGQRSFVLPTNLRAIANAARLDAEEFLWEHTSFPYIVAFMPPEEVARQRDRLLQRDSGERQYGGAVNKSVTQGLRQRRYCPDCVTADITMVGQSYWHRRHLLPATYFCLTHDRRLLDASVPLRYGLRFFDYSLPEEHEGVAPSPNVSPRILRSLTKRSTDAFATAWHHRSDWTSQYRNLALERGYALPGRQVASKVLTDDFRVFYGTPFLQDAGCDFKPGSHAAWPGLIGRERVNIPFSPARHVLMQVFLDNTEGPRSVSAQYRPPGPLRRDYAKADTDCERRVRKRLEKTAGTGKRHTVEDLLEEAGYWCAYRHDRTRFPRTAALIARFRASSQSERQLGTRNPSSARNRHPGVTA